MLFFDIGYACPAQRSFATIISATVRNLAPPDILYLTSWVASYLLLFSSFRAFAFTLYSLSTTEHAWPPHALSRFNNHDGTYYIRYCETSFLFHSYILLFILFQLLSCRNTVFCRCLFLLSLVLFPILCLISCLGNLGEGPGGFHKSHRLLIELLGSVDVYTSRWSWRRKIKQKGAGYQNKYQPSPEDLVWWISIFFLFLFLTRFPFLVGGDDCPS
jgi:hypothetical protein